MPRDSTWNTYTQLIPVLPHCTTTHRMDAIHGAAWASCVVAIHVSTTQSQVIWATGNTLLLPFRVPQLLNIRVGLLTSFTIAAYNQNWNAISLSPALPNKRTKQVPEVKLKCLKSALISRKWKVLRFLSLATSAYCSSSSPTDTFPTYSFYCWPTVSSTTHTHSLCLYPGQWIWDQSHPVSPQSAE